MNGNKSIARHWWLYVLRLEDSKYYVGITSKTPEVRMKEHQDGVRAAYWTAKHKPTEIIYREDLGIATQTQAEKRENKIVRAYMKKCGVNSVRGGDLTNTSEYVVRFGYIFDKEVWSDAVHILILLFLFIIFAVDKYIIAFLPGGVR